MRATGSSRGEAGVSKLPLQDTHRGPHDVRFSPAAPYVMQGAGELVHVFVADALDVLRQPTASDDGSSTGIVIGSWVAMVESTLSAVVRAALVVAHLWQLACYPAQAGIPSISSGPLERSGSRCARSGALGARNAEYA